MRTCTHISTVAPVVKSLQKLDFGILLRCPTAVESMFHQFCALHGMQIDFPNLDSYFYILSAGKHILYHGTGICTLPDSSSKSYS